MLIVRLFKIATAAVLALAAFDVAAIEVPGPLVETGWLADHQGEVVVLDVREDAASYLGTPPGPDEKPDLKRLAGHIPGAVSVPWKQVVAKGAEQGVELKAMLPAPEAFTALMQASGVNRDAAVVIAGYGTNAKDQAHAARLYFTLKYFGHDNVALLDGGTAQWAVDGRPLAYTPEAPTQGDFAIREARADLVVSTEEMEDAVASGQVQLVDCRPEDFYLGLTAKRGFVDPGQKGHLPGAKTLPFVLLSDNSGPARMFSAEQMREVAALKGVDLAAPTIAYCNTGVTASLGWFALHELLGHGETRLYDGSMHAWSKVPGPHPVVPLEEMAAQASRAGAPQGAAPAAAVDLDPETVLFRPSRSLQTLVEDRRDALNRRRDEIHDAVSGRRLVQPAWVTARQEMMDDYRDSMRGAHRVHRDTRRLYRDALRSAFMPGLQPYRDAAEIRHFVSRMEQLDRQEVHDGLRFAQGYLPW
jgi:thiosulfate/3-mercaptopyruvate sulfurtransferase